MSAQVNDFDPEDSDALRQSLLLAVPCFAVAVLVAVAFLLFFLIRCCCFCSGKGCCAKNKEPASRCTVFGYCVAALVMLAGAVMGGSFLAASGTGVSEALGGLADTLVEQVDIFANDLTVIIQTILQVAPEGSDLDVSQLETALGDIQNIQTDVKDIREDWNGVFQTVQKVVLVVGMSVVFCSVVSGLSLVTRKMTMLYTFFVFAMLSCFFTWLLGGVGSVVNVVFDETCNMMDLHLQGVRNEWLDSSLPCDELRDAMSGIGTAMEAANLAITEANDAINEANSQAIAVATATAQVYTPIRLMCLPFEEVNGEWQEASNPPPDCVPMTESSVIAEYGPRVCDEVTGVQGDLASDAQYQVCVADNRPLKREDYNTIVEAAISFEKITDVLPRIQRIANCMFVDSVFRAITEKDCPSMKSSTLRLTQAAICAGTALTLVALYFCLCFRNVRPQETQYVVGAAPAVDKTGMSAKLNRSGQQEVSAPIGAIV